MYKKVSSEIVPNNI